MRRTCLLAAFAAVAIAAVPASAGPDVPVRVYTEDGVGVYVGPEAHAIVGAGVDTEEGRACVVVGFSATCAP